jgi:hypothetical protein
MSMSARRVRCAVLCSALAALGASADLRAEDAPPVRPAHAVVVILSGGVRAREMLDPAVMPNVAAVGARGVVVDRLATGPRSPYASTVAFLTGRSDVSEDAARPRPSHPTLLECARRSLSLPPDEVWFVAHEGGDELRLARSDRADFGAAVAPSLAFGDGAFAEPLSLLLATWGHPIPTDEKGWSLLRGLRAKNRAAVEAWLPEAVDAGLAEAERVERALLAELDRTSLRVAGASPEDERAARSAVTVLEIHRPALLVVRLAAAQRAQESLDAYHAALRADDAAVGRLRAAVNADPALGAKTTFWVVTDMGRNATADAQGRIAADDDSVARKEVAAVAEGPGVRRGAKVKGERAVVDLAPTIGRLLGVAMPEATGKVLTSLLDPALAGN